MSSYWFIPLIIESILLLICIAYDSGWLATISLVVAGLVIHFAGFANLLSLVANHWLPLMCMGMVYIIAGTAWCLFKWTLFVRKQRDKYKEAKSSFFRGYVGPGDVNDAWNKIYKKESNKPPQVSDHKDKMALWFFYWPFSAINTLVRDFTKNLFNLVYNTVKDTFQNLSNHIYADIDKD